MATDTSTPCAVAPRRSLLVVAHPGHELRLYGWMTVARPEVLVLTDGSGSIAQPRVASSRRVLASAGATAGSLFGQYSDQDVYRAMLDTDHAFFAGIEAVIAARLASGDHDAVVADPFEGYNPTHDLCRLLVNVALERVWRQSGRLLRSYDYALTGPLPSCPSDLPSQNMSIDLSGAALATKVEAARHYPELQWEIEQAIAREGMQALACEQLRSLQGDRLRLVPPSLPPHYEVHGEKRRAAGIYTEVIRYEQHFLPIARGLVETLPGLPR